jgi:hypothetical protein
VALAEDGDRLWRRAGRAIEPHGVSPRRAGMRASGFQRLRLRTVCAERSPLPPTLDLHRGTKNRANAARGNACVVTLLSGWGDAASVGWVG